MYRYELAIGIISVCAFGFCYKWINNAFVDAQDSNSQYVNALKENVLYETEYIRDESEKNPNADLTSEKEDLEKMKTRLASAISKTNGEKK